MNIPRGALGLACFAVASLGGGVGAAAAATTHIGAVNEIGANADPEPISSGGFTVQVAEASGTYAVPAGYGVITAWTHKTGTGSGVLTFKVYRPTGAPKEFRLVGADTRTVTAGALEAFPVRIPVAPGDRIGLSSDAVQLAYQSFDPADRIGFFDPDPGPGAVDTTDGEPFPGFKLDVAATVETDLNGDGLGDDSQRAGVGSPATASKASISPRAFRAAPSGSSATASQRRRYGAKVTYHVNIAATVRFTVTQPVPGRRIGAGRKARCVPQTRRNRKARKCTRVVTLRGSFAQSAKAGANSFHFTGRLGGKRLKPGKYALIATPSTNGKTGKSAGTTFRIIR
jgi:hypothetical protein